MFRHSIKQGTRKGALNDPAASSTAGSAGTANWKGVQAYGYQHFEVENLRGYQGWHFRRHEVEARLSVAQPQHEGDGNLSDPYRKAAGQRRSCHCQVAAADGSPAVQLWSRRRICRGLVSASISAAGTGRPGQRPRRNIVTIETAISRIGGRFPGHSPGAELSQ